jgi:hypothetical protein
MPWSNISNGMLGPLSRPTARRFEIACQTSFPIKINTASAMTTSNELTIIVERTIPNG